VHGKHEPTCSFCAKFVFPFSEDSPLAEWGYCRDEVRRAPTEAEIGTIEEQAEKGDYSFLTNSRFPLYQPLGEGCEKFEDEGHD